MSSATLHDSELQSDTIGHTVPLSLMANESAMSRSVGVRVSVHGNDS